MRRPAKGHFAPKRVPKLELRHAGRIRRLKSLDAARMPTDMTLKAVVHVAEEGGFWAEVPALPGCMTQGETMEEIEANLREVIDLWLSVDEPAEPLAADDRVLELAV